MNRVMGSRTIALTSHSSSHFELITGLLRYAVLAPSTRLLFIDFSAFPPLPLVGS